jgi:surfactin synthase thioesterase subunit
MASGPLSSRWFLREPVTGAQARVFCLPYSGCGASMYRQWPVEYEGVNFCPVQLPGRENRLREPAFATYQDLADVLADQLVPYLDRPYGLFGHCSSALAAYETSVRLVERGRRPPSRLFVSSAVAPQDGPFGSFLEMDDATLAAELRSLFIGMGGIPSAGFIEMTVGIMRQDVEVNRHYHPADLTVLPCPITVISWSDDQNIEPERMNGWSACGPTKPVMLLGGHYRFIEAPAALLSELVGAFTTVADEPNQSDDNVSSCLP